MSKIDDNVPMTYVLSKYSKQINSIFNILYSIYGSFAFIILYKILKQRPKIWYTIKQEVVYGRNEKEKD